MKDESEYLAMRQHHREIGSLVVSDLLLEKSQQSAVILRAVIVYRSGIRILFEFLRGPELTVDDWFNEVRSAIEHVSALGHPDADPSWAPRLFVGGEEPSAVAARDAGASEDSFEMDLWLEPLPTSQPISLALRWPSLGIEDASIVLPRADIAQAADSARSVW